MGDTSGTAVRSVRIAAIVAGSTAACIAAYLLSRSDYLLFHSLVETFVALVAFGIFVIAWNTSRINESTFLAVLGAGMLFTGLTELLHMFAYRGMGVFSAVDADLATQLWICSRLLTAAAFATAGLSRPGRPSTRTTFIVFGGVWTALMASIFVWPIFPVMYVPGVGLTPLKIVLEVVAMAVFAATGALMWRRRHEFAPQVAHQLIAAIVLQIVSGVAFTLYVDVYGVTNTAGHLALLASSLLVYRALIETGLRTPYALLFRQLHEREQAEHRIADVLQSALLSAPDAIPGVVLGSAFRSATSGARIGGDFYDLWTPSANRLAFVIGDVCGKGVEAAATTAVVRATLRSFAYEEPDPCAVLRRTNDAVLRDLPEDRFVTVVYGLIDREAGVLRIAGAGHPNPIVRRPGASAKALELPSNPPLGVVRQQWFDCVEVGIEPGDEVVLFTDGLLDAGWRIGGFGEWRAIDTVSVSRALEPAQLAEHLLQTAVVYSNETLSDDAAVVVLRYTGPDHPGATV